MIDGKADGQRSGIGLCPDCLHSRPVTSTRGATFSLCERSTADPSFAKYPHLPVLRCLGYEPREIVSRAK